MLDIIIARAIIVLSEVIEYLILIRLILQIFNMPYNILMKFLIGVTEPLLAPARALLFKIFKNQMFDFSPIVVWCLLDYVIVPALITLVQYIF